MLSWTYLDYVCSRLATIFLRVRWHMVSGSNTGSIVVSQIYALSESLMLLLVGMHPLLKIIFYLASIAYNISPPILLRINMPSWSFSSISIPKSCHGWILARQVGAKKTFVCKAFPICKAKKSETFLRRHFQPFSFFEHSKMSLS